MGGINVAHDEDVAELEARADDPEEWEEEPDEISVQTRTRTEVVSFRLPCHELDEVAEAAEAAGESLSEYVRGALDMRLRGLPDYPAPLEVSSLSLRTAMMSSRTIMLGSPQVWKTHDVDHLVLAFPGSGRAGPHESQIGSMSLHGTQEDAEAAGRAAARAEGGEARSHPARGTQRG